MAERSKLFEDEPEPDISQFKPRVDPLDQQPTLAEVRGVSTVGGFPSRESRPVIPERHYYRTGRDTQFNAKVRPDVKAAFLAVAAEDGIPIGKVLEDALDALMRERVAKRSS
jgi:hypothetical protein